MSQNPHFLSTNAGNRCEARENAYIGSYDWFYFCLVEKVARGFAKARRTPKPK